MDTTLGYGYSGDDESALTDFYSPPSSLDQGLFYSGEEEIESNKIFASLSMEEMNEDEFKSLPFKLMSIETTPPPTPLIPRRSLDPTIMDFQNMKINITPTNWSLNPPGLPKTPTNLLTPTSMDRYLMEHRRLSKSFQTGHQSLAVEHREITNGLSINKKLFDDLNASKSLSETSRLYSYMTPIDRSSNSWSTFNDPKSSREMNSIFPNNNNNQWNQFSSVQDPWLISEIFRQNNNNHNHISLSTTAQQILNGNNRPLRSEKIDIEVIKHLIREANWKRQCGMKKEICVFCRNNGENELIYSSHSLKDPMGNVTCPILRAYHCPICGATGAQAHTIKYCQSTGDDHHRHVLTPYEKMLRIQTFGFDDPIPSFLGQFSSPSSLYTNGWSDSYL